MAFVPGTPREPLRATSTALLHHDLNVRHDQISAIVRIAPEVLQAYEEYYATVNPWVAGAKDKGLIYPGCVVVGEAACSEAELKRTEFYTDWMKPADLRHEFGCNVFLTNERMTNVTVLRPAPAGLPTA